MAMAWPDVRRRITAVLPGRAILKCDGIGSRPVTSNDSAAISMRTGVKTAQTKAISYEMLEYALAVLNQTGRFTSAWGAASGKLVDQIEAWIRENRARILERRK